MCVKVWTVLLLAYYAYANEDGDRSSWSSFGDETSNDFLKKIDKGFDDFSIEGPHGTAASNNFNRQVALLTPLSAAYNTRSYPVQYIPQPKRINDNRQVQYDKPRYMPRHTKPVYAPQYSHFYNKKDGLVYPVANLRQNNVLPQAFAYVAPGNSQASKLRPRAAVPSQSKNIQRGYQVFHPYNNIKPALQKYNNDPSYFKIKKAVNNNEKRLRKKEELLALRNANDDNRDITNTPKRNEQNENFQPQYESYYPKNSPQYYKVPPKAPINYKNINKKLNYPKQNHGHVKIHPNAYIPLKKHIGQLKRHQGKTFAGDKSEYPALKSEDDDYEDRPDGYDIFERQKANYDTANARYTGNYNGNRNNQPPQNSYRAYPHHSEDDDSHLNANLEFIPVKMYAQVRHTETTKHLPREAALADAETYDEVINAPRLREAIKSSKAQTVYTEEGYEDSAYDHNGHLKHASNHEDHSGHSSGGHVGDALRTRHGEARHHDQGGNIQGHDVTDSNKWSDDKGDTEDFENHSDYANKDGERESKTNDLTEAGSEKKTVKKTFLPRNISSTKGQMNNKLIMTTDSEKTMIRDVNDGGSMMNAKTKHNDSGDKPKYVRLRPSYYWKKQKKTDTVDKTPKAMDLNLQKSKVNLKTILKDKFPSIQRRTKREANYQKSLRNINNGFTENDVTTKIIGKQWASPSPKEASQKYPYYSLNLDDDILRHSPLRYAQNIAYIPRKTKGGSEFYDSRSSIHCSEVAPDIDPVPERIKNKMPDDDEDEDEEDEDFRNKRDIHKNRRSKRDNFEQNEEQPRLKGLGDKIDCFKDKYFGANPLDSPFFAEEEIEPPEPLHIMVSSPIKLQDNSNIFNVNFNRNRDRTDKLKESPVKPILDPFSDKYPNPITDSSNEHISQKVNTDFKPNNSKRQTFESKKNLSKGKNKNFKTTQNNLITAKNAPNKYDITSFPGVLFDKYTDSHDPQMRIYGDVIGNIQGNIQVPTYKNTSPISSVTQPIYYEKRHSNGRKNSESKGGPERDIRKFGRLNKIYSPNEYLRKTRNNHFMYEPYKIINHSPVLTKKPQVLSLRPQFKIKKKTANVERIPKFIEPTIKLRHQLVKRNVNMKQYKDIGKSDRTTVSHIDVEMSSVTPPTSSEDDHLVEDTSSSDTIQVDKEDESFDSRRGEPRYENTDHSRHKNHKKYYSPVTVKTSISPKELDVEDSLKDSEDSDTSLTELSPTTEESINKVESSDEVIDENDNYTHLPSDENNERSKKTNDERTDDDFNITHRFKISEPQHNQNVNDNSKAVYVTTYHPRHNYSSKYNSKDELIPQETSGIIIIPKTKILDSLDEDVTNESDSSTETTIAPETNVKEELIRHTIEVYPSVTSVPEVHPPSAISEEYLPNENKFNDLIYITTTEKPNSRRRKRVKVSTTTYSPVTQNIFHEDNVRPVTRKTNNRDPKNRISKNKHHSSSVDDRGLRRHSRTTQSPINVDNYYTPTTERKREYREPDTKKDTQNNLSKDNPNAGDAVSQWRKVLQNQNTPPITTTVATVYQRPVRPKRKRRPSARIHSHYDTNQHGHEADRDIISHKPRILEKTSKKRKTTVITNSKRYEKNGNREPVVDKTQYKQISEQPEYVVERQIENPENRRPNVEESDVREINHNQSPDNRYNDDVQRDRPEDDTEDETEGDNQRKTEEIQPAPVNEESRYEEDVEEEEVIHERPGSTDFTDKSYGFYHDPELAKQVNQLSEIKKDDQHPVHSDVEVFRADFKMNRGPRHGGNYKKLPTAKRNRKKLDEASELEDLNIGEDVSEEPLHGGNYRAARNGNIEPVRDGGRSARVLSSFASLLPMTTTSAPIFEKDPGKRLYFFVKD